MAKSKKRPAPKLAKGGIVEPSDKLIGEEVGAPVQVVANPDDEPKRPDITIKGKLSREQKVWLMEQLTSDVDYGKIHVVSKDKCPAEYKQSGSCDKGYHYSKAVLLKPGQEKIFGLFEITDKLTKDTETMEMLSSLPHLVAYICKMTQNGQEVGEGRGAGEVGEQGRRANSTIKIAEKRARMDAALSLGLSDLFAQDLDDPDFKDAVKIANEKVAAEAERRDTDEFGLWPRDPELPIDDNERKVLFKHIHQVGYKQRDDILALLSKNNLEADALTSGQAREFLKALRDGTYEAVPVKAAPAVEPAADVPNPDDIDLGASLDAAEAEMQNREPEPELVVDEDLKNWVRTEIEHLNLNPSGAMWLKKEITGKPFGDLEQMTDKHWRRAYQVLTGIIDGEIEVSSRYRRQPPTNPTSMNLGEGVDQQYNDDGYQGSPDDMPNGMEQRHRGDPSMH